MQTKLLSDAMVTPIVLSLTVDCEQFGVNEDCESCIYVEGRRRKLKRAANYNERPQQRRQIRPTIEQPGQTAGAG